MENTLNPVQNPVLRPFSSSPIAPKMKNSILALISVVVVLAGIGTGYSSKVPCYNPLDLIEWIKAWIDNEEIKERKRESKKNDKEK